MTLLWVAMASAAAQPAAGDIDRIIVQASVQQSRLAEPISLSVLSGDIQSFLSPRAPAELLNRAPGVFVQSGSGREHLTAIRSPVLTGGAGAGSFLFLQDGVPLRAPGFANVNGLFHAAFPFAEEVAVVRGPGDVAYGSNALHGLVDVRTADPGEAGSSALFSYGSFDRYRAIGTLDRENVRVGLSVLDDGGYRDQSGATEIKSNAAARFGEGILRVSLHQLEQETAGFILGDDAFEDDELRRSNPNPEAFRDVRHTLISYEQPFEVAGWRGEFTPFFRWTDMEFLLHFFPGDPLEENEHMSIGAQSIAFRELADGLELAVGLDVDVTEGSLREFQENPTVFSFVQGLHYDYEVQSAEVAPFAKLDWQATERLALQAGLRGTFTHYDYENKAPVGEVGRYLRLDDQTRDYQVATGKLSATYAVTDAHTIYTSVARSARPPQTTELFRLQPGQEISEIEPETIESVELGWRMGTRRTNLAVTGFAMRKENVFFRDSDGINVTDAETTHIGVEAEGSVALTETLTLSGSGTYAEHRYDFDRPVGNASEAISDGDIIDTAPKTLATAQLTWRPTPVWRFEAAYTHVGEYPMNAAGTVTYDGHDLLDLRISRALGDKLELTGIVRNATDERYARRADFAFGNERFFPGEEVAGEVVLSAKF